MSDVAEIITSIDDRLFVYQKIGPNGSEYCSVCKRVAVVTSLHELGCPVAFLRGVRTALALRRDRLDQAVELTA